jgi:hypothetical protein
MRRITPYKTTRGALAALDNGGRFYNFGTDADDGQIEPSELAKVAGVFTSGQSMFLYFDLALSRLSEEEVGRIHAAMSPALQEAYARYRPRHFSPQLANRGGRAGMAAVVRGVPHFVKSKTDFNGFIMMPMMAGNVTTFMMIPIMDQYDVYELRDEKTDREFLIAHARGQRRLRETEQTFGGVLKELNRGKAKIAKKRLFLECVYYA